MGVSFGQEKTPTEKSKEETLQQQIVNLQLALTAMAANTATVTAADENNTGGDK